MSSKTITQHLKSLINEVMKNEGEENYELIISGNGIKGEGYMGEIIFATIRTGLNGFKRNYEFFIKSAKRNEKLRSRLPVRDAYLREILLYNKIFPVFEEFQLENSTLDTFQKYPKCYKTCDETQKETVILENLRTQGFELHNRKITMNLEHMQLVFTQYARFHAISMAMKQLNPELFKNLTKNVDDIFAHFVVVTDMLPGFIEFFRNVSKFLNKNQLKKFEGYEAEIEELLIKNNFDIDDPCTVIIHGDCWNNNIMFKYDKTNKTRPIDVRFLDYQYSRISHPLFDLSTFLYSCCDGKMLKNFDFLLELYHSTLSDSLAQYCIDINTFYPLNKLKSDWKKFGKYGLYYATLTIPISICENNETPDLENLAENDADFKDAITSIKNHEENYCKRIKPILEHFLETFL